MGYCWSGTFSVNGANVLQRVALCNLVLRYNVHGLLRGYAQLAERIAKKHAIGYPGKHSRYAILAWTAASCINVIRYQARSRKRR